MVDMIRGCMTTVHFKFTVVAAHPYLNSMKEEDTVHGLSHSLHASEWEREVRQTSTSPGMGQLFLHQRSQKQRYSHQQDICHKTGNGRLPPYFFFIGAACLVCTTSKTTVNSKSAKAIFSSHKSPHRSTINEGTLIIPRYTDTVHLER